MRKLSFILLLYDQFKNFYIPSHPIPSHPIPSHPILSLLSLIFLCSPDPGLEAQTCEWEKNVCISYCSSTFFGEGSTVKCFNASTATINAPVQLLSCFNSSSEQSFSSGGFTISKRPQFILCMPLNVCSASIKVLRVTGEGTSVIEELIKQDNNVYIGTNRDTPCDNCPSPNSYFTLPHSSYTGLLGKYKIELSYTCCGSNEVKTFSFYYEIVDAASSADVTLAYLASTQIENLNNDPVINGILPYNGGSPGPALGAASSGVTVSTVGTGISSYTVKVFELNCTSGGMGTLLSSATFPGGGSGPVQYSFTSIPGWGTSFDPRGKCFRVEVTATGFCGTFTKTGFFTITNTCLFCKGGDDEVSERSPGTMNQGVEVYPNPSSGLVQVVAAQGIKSVQILNTAGQSMRYYDNIADPFAIQNYDLNNVGIYYVRVHTLTNEIRIQKLIIAQ